MRPALAILLSVVALLQTGCGTFSYAMKPADKVQTFRHPLVISLVGPKITVQNMGLTVFNEKTQTPSVPEWGIDDLLEGVAAARLRGEGIVPRTATPAQREQARSLVWSDLLNCVTDIKFEGFVQQHHALFGDCDSVLFIIGAGGKVQARFSGPGLLALTIIKPRGSVYLGTVRVFGYAVPSGRQLAWAHGNDNGYQRSDLPYKEPFSNYTSAERETMRTKIREVTEKSLNEALARAGI